MLVAKSPGATSVSYTHLDVYKRQEISKSAGNLCLHLIGNLNHFIGAVLGKNGYVRQRDNEFLLKNIPSSSLINQIEQTRLMAVSYTHLDVYKRQALTWL